MADQILRASFFSVDVPDKAGEGAKILAALRRAKLNLLAFSGFPTGEGKAEIHLIVGDPDELRSVAARAGFPLEGPKTCFLIQGDDRIGALADVVTHLKEARINMKALDALGVGGGRFGGILWVEDEDVERAAEVLKAQPVAAAEPRKADPDTRSAAS